MSFEIDAGFEAVEGAANTGGTIVTSPAPFPDTESRCLQLPQSSSFNRWRGNTFSFTAGDAFEVLFMIRFSKAGGAPYTNDIPFLTIHDGTNDHLTLNLMENGGVNDLQILDAAGSVCATISGPVMSSTSNWFFGRLLVRLHDTLGACELEIISTNTGSILWSASCSNEDFKTAVDNVGLRFKSEGPPSTPAQPTTVFIGSALLFSGLTTPLDTSEFHRRYYTCFGASPTKNSVTPDCDSAGNDPGNKDDLDVGTWDKAGDGLAGAGNQCQYTTFEEEGAVKVGHPGSDSQVNRGLIRYGMEWVWDPAGTIHGIYGKETSGGYTVAIDTTATKIVEDNSGGNIPDLDKDAVIGFIHKQPRGNPALNEAWCISAFRFPLIPKEIGPPVFAGRTGRIVL